MKRGRGKERRVEGFRKRVMYGSKHRMSPQFFKNNVNECGLFVYTLGVCFRTTVRNYGNRGKIIRVGHGPHTPINVKTCSLGSKGLGQGCQLFSPRRQHWLEWFEGMCWNDIRKILGEKAIYFFLTFGDGHYCLAVATRAAGWPWHLQVKHYNEMDVTLLFRDQSSNESDYSCYRTCICWGFFLLFIYWKP